MSVNYDSSFLQIFHNNLVGMLLSDEQHIIIDINDHLLNLAQLKREDVIGKTGLELGILNETFIKKIWEEFTLHEKLLNRELVFTTKNNKSVHCLFSTEKIELNSTFFWLTTIIDITNRKKAEKQLAEFYERVTDGFIAIDRNWCYTYVNRRAGELLGKDPAYLIGKHVWTEFPQKETNSFYVAYHQAMKNQEMLIVEEYVDTHGCWFQNLIYPSADGLSVFFRDITNSKENEKKISESERRFKTLTKTAPVGIFETNAHGATTYVNETWMQYSGMNFEEAMGDGWLNAVHPEDRDWLEKGWHSKTKIKAESFSEYRIVDKTGKLLWVNGKAVPVFNSDGVVTGYIGIILDVTERKNAESRILNSEESKRLILNSALDAIIIIDSTSKIIFWNQQAENIFGWSEAEVIGRQLTETILPLQYVSEHQLGMGNYLQTGNGPILNRQIEISALNKSGVIFPIELSILPVEQETGKSFCAFIRDITERKNAETSLKESSEQLRKLNRHLQKIREEERSNIAREIHDELGQQLTGLKMDIAWLMKKTVQEDTAIKTKFNETLLLLDDTVRSIRRICTELRPSIIDDLGLNAALEWQVAEFGERLDIKISYENNFNDKNIQPDVSIALFRILQESLTNIAKHAAAKKVIITIEQVNNMVHLSVTDDGMGFDSSIKQRDLTFGLLGIKERTSTMQGECNILSKPGGGTTIEVKIPLRGT